MISYLTCLGVGELLEYITGVSLRYFILNALDWLKSLKVTV